ncbi:hypothetical protein CLOP_g2981 [Closterium sp. NIES-67]|nr:hypothetical protein CLOP_g2981 [Closterium sp. NIES-67]
MNRSIPSASQPLMSVPTPGRCLYKINGNIFSVNLTPPCIHVSSRVSASQKATRGIRSFAAARLKGVLEAESHDSNHGTGESAGGVLISEESSDTVPLPQSVAIAGESVDVVVPRSQAKSRLDAFLAAQGERISRARWQDAIREGTVLVNGRAQKKPSYAVREGDRVQGSLAPPKALQALEPSAVALDVVYEDGHVVVVNKAAHMVVHPAAGNWQGTLVNALLHHYQLPSSSSSLPSSSDLLLEERGEESSQGYVRMGMTGGADVRPGIVHRLDKGTSGLLVVAKDSFSQAHLSAQFKARTVHRSYLSLVIGTPAPHSDRVDAPIGRDPKDRKRMAVLPMTGSHRSRRAASRYRVVESLAGGAAALVEWRLETGRTHQIRVHARFLGHPLIGDETYGGSIRHVSSRLLASLPSSSPLRSSVAQWIAGLDRPLLHAATLGFVHPETLEFVTFEVPPPSDFIMALGLLRSL